MRTNKTSSKITLLIPITAAIIAIVAVVFVVIKIGAPLKTSKTNSIDKNSDHITVENIIDDTNVNNKGSMSYVTETNYTGELAKFPGLYDIEFKKSNAYISNKDFSKEHQDIFMICEESATDFYDTLFNVDYRDIVEDKNAFVANVMKNCDYGSYHIKNYGLETEETEYLFEYIMDIADYFVENQVEMTAKFYTDDSMVYSDYYTFVRGALCFTIFENNDNNSEYKKGIEYVIPMEVSMERATFDSSIRVITSFGKAEDKTFFLSE